MYGRPPLDEFSYSDREHYWREECAHFSKLWKLATRWPHPVPLLVFYYLGAEDQTRAETYQQCSDALHAHAHLEPVNRLLGSIILESSVGRLHPQTIALGCKSSDANASSDSLAALPDLGRGRRGVIPFGSMARFHL